MEKYAQDNLLSYETEILEFRLEKYFIINKYSKYTDEVQEKFADQSYNIIKEFKYRFKKLVTFIHLMLQQKMLRTKQGVKALIDKLYEIEIWLKQKVSDVIKEFYNEI